MNQKYMQDRMADMLKQADEMQTTIDTMDEDVEPDRADGGDHAQHGRQDEGHGRRHRRIARQHRRISTTSSGRIRNYFYWEPHCYDIPVCWAIRSVFDTLDGIDTMTDDIQQLVPEHGTPRRADAADGRADAAA